MNVVQEVEKYMYNKTRCVTLLRGGKVNYFSLSSSAVTGCHLIVFTVTFSVEFFFLTSGLFRMVKETQGTRGQTPTNNR